MEQGKSIPKSLIESIKIIREHQKMIQVNLDILEILKLKGAISLTDKHFIEIINLDKKHRRMFEEFVLNTLPNYLSSESAVTDKVLSKQFQVWASDLIISLSHLDKICKGFIQNKINSDKKLKRSIKAIEVKDKRFWRFLDKVKGKSQVFESFNEDSEDAELIEDL
ncbi:MAG: hypothetical protein KAH17_01345 [Bacteroidales bacterium]|nr:hypothetical protein [Bacteroidales bacterium]